MLNKKLVSLLTLLGLTVTTWAQESPGPVPELLHHGPWAQRVLVADTESDEDTENEWWIGVLPRPVEDALRAQIDLPDGVGLQIRQVMPDSPAEKAGVLMHDIFVSVEEVPLTDAQVLINAISKADGKPIEVELLRAGKREQKTITPVKTPEADFLKIPRGQVGEPNIDGVKALLEQLQNGTANGKGARFRFFGPGAEIEEERSLPANLNISIQRSGDEPARIKVTQGDSSWDISEDEIDQLPDDVRPHVERMLGNSKIQFFGGLGSRLEGLPGFGNGDEGRMFPNIDEQFREMNERFDQLFDRLRQMEEFQQRQPAAPADDEETRDASFHLAPRWESVS